MKLDFCRFKNAEESGGTAELFFYGDIVSDSWAAWTREDQYPGNVADLLKDIGDSDVDVHINSCGGEVFAGIAICNMLRNCKGKKTVYIDGLAASIASVIAMAGDKIVMPENAFLMVHKSWCMEAGNADDLRKTAQLLDKLDESIVTTYMIHADKEKTEDDFRSAMEEETWMTAKQAAEYFDNIVIQEPFKAVAAVNSAYIEKYKNMPECLRVNNPKCQPNRGNDMTEYKKYLELLDVLY